jgi:enoyl-CoA hydratase/carnithine racemase
MSSSPAPAIRCRSEGGIAWLVIDNPARHNAISLGMWAELTAAMARLEADPAVRVAVLQGAGPAAFASGADIGDFKDGPEAAAALAEWNRLADAAWQAIADFRKPLLGLVRGWCLGGGLAVATQCDLRYAAEGARFGIPAAKLGGAYPWALMKRLVDLVGPATAKQMIFTGATLDAAEALRLGLVDRVLPEAELEATVTATAAQIAGNAPLTLLAAKEVLRELAKPAGFDAAHCDAVVGRCFASADFEEGRRAFMEKRKPVFRGR